MFYQRNPEVGLRSALRLARISAIKLGQPVKFCGSHDFKKCEKDSWREGRIIVAGSGKIIRRFSSVSDKDKIVFEGNANNGISFLPTGFLSGIAGKLIYYPNGSQKNAISVVFNRIGRVRVDNPKRLQ